MLFSQKHLMNLVIRISSWSLRLLKKMYSFSDAVLSGFWLGVLSEKNIGKYNDLHYDAGLTYINDNYNLSGLQRWEHEMLKKFFSKSTTFMIIGAGGGRETAALRKWEREVDSYECSGRLVRYANDFLRRNNIDATVTYLEKNSVPQTSKQYDGIILGWGAYSHIPGSGKRTTLLRALQPFCRKETRIMISFLVKDGMGRKDKIIKNVSNFFRYFTGRSKTESGDRLLSYYAHFFDKSEIDAELTAAGFKMLEYSDLEYGCAVAERR